MDSIIELILPTLLKPIEDHNKRAEVHHVDPHVYKQWRECEGIARDDNIDVTYNVFADLRYPSGESLMDVSKHARKRWSGPGTYNDFVCADVADKVAKGLVVLEQFGEQGVIELQTSIQKYLEDALYEFEERPPF